MFFKKRERQCGELVVVGKNDLPPESLIKKYSFLAEIKDNPLVYMRKAGYFEARKQTFNERLFSEIKILIYAVLIYLVLYICANNKNGMYILYILMMGYLSRDTWMKLFLKKNVKSDSGFRTTVGLSIHSENILKFLNFGDKQKCIDLCSSQINGRDYVLSYLASSVSRESNIYILYSLWFILFMGIIQLIFFNVLTVIIFLLGIIAWCRRIYTYNENNLHHVIIRLKEEVNNIENEIEIGPLKNSIKKERSLEFVSMISFAICLLLIYSYKQMIHLLAANTMTSFQIAGFISFIIFTFFTIFSYSSFLSNREVKNPGMEIHELSVRIDRIMKFAVKILNEDEEDKFQNIRTKQKHKKRYNDPHHIF